MTLQDPFSSQEKRYIRALIIVAIISFFYQLGIYPLFLEEPRRAMIALEMLLQDNLWVPTQTGDLYYRKPPLYNWLIILSSHLLGGINEIAVRAVSVGSHLLLGIFVYKFFQKRTSQEVALLTSLSFVLSVDILFHFSALGEIDLFYALLTASSIMLVFKYGDEERYWQLFLSVYLLTAACFLTKGLSALPYTALTLLAYFIYNKKFKMLLSIQHVAGIALFAVILFLYFKTYATYEDVSGWWSTLLFESTDKAAGGGFSKFISHLIAFPLDTLKNIIPATLLIPALMGKGDKKKVNQVWLWVIGVNFFVYWYSVEGRARYIYPLFPFMCYWLVERVSVFNKEWFNTYLKIFGYVLLSVLTLALPAILFVDSLSYLSNRWAFVAVGEACLLYLWICSLKLQVRPFLIIMGVLVVGKLAFSFVVPQTRMLKSNAAKDKELAFEIAALTSEEPIYRWGDVRFSLTTAFYLEREKAQILYKNDKVELDAYYFVYDDEMIDFPNSDLLLTIDYHGDLIHLLKPIEGE